jgi:hypothetical protein
MRRFYAGRITSEGRKHALMTSGIVDLPGGPRHKRPKQRQLEHTAVFEERLAQANPLYEPPPPKKYG